MSKVLLSGNPPVHQEFGFKGELLPCPFCGSSDAALRHVLYESGMHAAYVLCCSCDSYGPFVYAYEGPDYADKAVAAWNRRV